MYKLNWELIYLFYVGVIWTSGWNCRPLEITRWLLLSNCQSRREEEFFEFEMFARTIASRHAWVQINRRSNIGGHPQGTVANPNITRSRDESAIGALKFCKPGFHVFDKVYRLLEFSSLKLKVMVTCLGIKLGDGKDIWKGEAEERFRDAPSTMVWRALSADKRHQCKDHQLHQYRRHHHLHLHYHPSSFTITIMTSHPPYQHRLHHRHHRRRQHQHDTTT